MRNRARIPLSKAKVRQSWSKYNLYNLSRLITPPYKTRTFFQQKWSAKSALRAYHSEQVSEGRWERMFSRRLRSVVPMRPEYLARNDGSLESAGRGSGLDKKGSKKRRNSIPYMQMTFAPLERRLDTAIFRALFASSARQARQFVVHGAVKVNGKKMRHPGYLLNPGDMFQVDPEQVMFATGAPKSASDLSESGTTVKDGSVGGEESAAASEGASEAEGQGQQAKDQVGAEVVEEEEEEHEQDPRKLLKSLLAQAKSVLGSSKEKGLSAKRKQEIRGFQRQVKRQLSRSNSSTILTDSLEAQFLELKNQLLRPANQLPSEQKDTASSSSSTSTSTSTSSSTPPESKSETAAESETATRPAPATTNTQPSPQSLDHDAPELSEPDLNLLQQALQRLHNNPLDPDKPYATPWSPRPYMSAFAFIPPYLEVNQNVCAAVYLRHPVARPGLAEVPTPFGQGTGGEAFAWYLRRR